MARVIDFYNFLDSIYPFSLQEDWDNSGLLVGDKNKEVTRAAVVLDITEDAVQYASQVGAELIISHHPVIFKAKRELLKGDAVYTLAQNSMSAICAHTNLDCAGGGVNDVLAQLLDIQNVEVFPCDCSPELLRVGVLPQKMSADELALQIKDALGGCVRYCCEEKQIESVALCSGSGCSFVPDVIKAGIDSFITGDASHHDFIDCKEKGLALFAAGHFETENPVVSVLANKLRCEFPDTDIIVIPQKNPVKYI